MHVNVIMLSRCTDIHITGKVMKDGCYVLHFKFMLQIIQSDGHKCYANNTFNNTLDGGKGEGVVNKRVSCNRKRTY